MLSINEISEYLRKSTFFAGASDALIKSLAESSELIRIKAGEMLFGKGELGTAMYFVVDGRVRIHSEDIVITELSDSSQFGLP